LIDTPFTVTLRSYQNINRRNWRNESKKVFLLSPFSCLSLIIEASVRRNGAQSIA
jgi:hypothetical protein